MRISSYSRLRCSLRQHEIKGNNRAGNFNPKNDNAGNKNTTKNNPRNNNPRNNNPRNNNPRNNNPRNDDAGKESGLGKFNRILSGLLSERGSVSPLVIVYFLITLVVIFIGINVSHTYLERRHLVFALEASLQRASQKIDDFQYYTGYVDRNTLNFGARGQTTFLPIDCDAAKEVFRKEFELQWNLTQKNNPPELEIRGADVIRQRVLTVKEESPGKFAENSKESPTTSVSEKPRITSFSCDGKTLNASAEVVVNLPFVISFAGVDFISQSRQSESVEVGLIFGG